MPVNLPTNLLRSFVAIVESGSMQSAADQVFVTQSALSLQIKRLEELVQQSLFTREGRRLALTAHGEVLVEYARRVLALHDEALAAINAGQFAGPVRIGMVQDFAETLFGGLLSRFAGLHPDAQIFAKVTGTAELQTMLERRQLDILLGFAASDVRNPVGAAPMLWYGNVLLADYTVVPLAVLERPCRFLDAAISRLEAAGRRFRIAVETPNLSTLRAAVQAGLGLTCRTPMFLNGLDEVRTSGLPPLPDVACIVESAAMLAPAAARLAEMATEIVRERLEQTPATASDCQR